MHCLYCGEQIRRPRGHASVNFCSGAHRTAYYQKAFERPPVSKELAGFKPSSVAFEVHAATPPEAQEYAQAVRLPGVWHLSSTSKRGVSGRQGFSHKRVAAAIFAPVRAKPVPVPALPQHTKRCILPEGADPANKLGSMSQATTLHVPVVSPAPDRPPEIREFRNSWKDPEETFEHPALLSSFAILQRAPEPGLTPEAAIVPAIQASESQPVLDGRWLRQPPRIGLGAERCLPEASRFEKEEGPRFVPIGAAVVETRMIEPPLANVVSGELVPAIKPRGDLPFRLAVTLSAQLASAVAPLPGVVMPRKARMGERDREPIPRLAKVRRPAAIRLPEPTGPHNADSWATFARNAGPERTDEESRTRSLRFAFRIRFDREGSRTAPAGAQRGRAAHAPRSGGRDAGRMRSCPGSAPKNGLGRSSNFELGPDAGDSSSCRASAIPYQPDACGYRCGAEIADFPAANRHPIYVELDPRKLDLGYVARRRQRLDGHPQRARQPSESRISRSFAVVDAAARHLERRHARIAATGKIRGIRPASVDACRRTNRHGRSWISCAPAAPSGNSVYGVAGHCTGLIKLRSHRALVRRTSFLAGGIA